MTAPVQAMRRWAWLDGNDGEATGHHGWPLTGARTLSLTRFVGQRSDSARRVDTSTPSCHASGSPSTDEVLAATAHELRLPLSHIKGFVSSLRRTDVNWDDDTRKEFMAEIELETDRLAEVVDSLLAARTRRGRYKPATHLAFTHPASVVRG